MERFYGRKTLLSQLIPQSLKESGSISKELREPELEIRGAGILILGAFNEQVTPDLLEQAKSWFIRHHDNWALVDTFCGIVLSPMLERYPEVEKTLTAWSRQESMWLRRAALVTFVPFARHGIRHETSYRLGREPFRDPEDLMHKATGWLLREAGKTILMTANAFIAKARKSPIQNSKLRKELFCCSMSVP